MSIKNNPQVISLKSFSYRAIISGASGKKQLELIRFLSMQRISIAPRA